MANYIGARLSLISKSDIRYVGILHEIDSQNSTVSLEQVRSFGTEGRKGDAALEIPASENVFEYIVFRGSDVKDLRVESSNTAPAQASPTKPQDPAIVETGPAPQNVPGQQGRQQGEQGRGQQEAPYPPQQQQAYGMPPQGYPGGPGYGGYPPGPFGGPPRGYGGYPGHGGPMQGPPGGFPPMPPQQYQQQPFPPSSQPQGTAQQSQQRPQDSASARPAQAQAAKPVQASPFAAASVDGFPELPASNGASKPATTAPVKTEGARATQGKVVPALPLPQHASPAPQQQQRKGATMADVTKGVSTLSTTKTSTQGPPKTNALLEVKRAMPSAPANQQQPQPQQQQQQQQQQSRQDSSQNGQRRPSAPLQQQRQGTPRGQTQGNVIVAQPLEIPSGEYDFAAANSKFEKPSEAEAEKPAEPSYNKTSSFFDTLSSESQQRATYQQQVSGEAGAGAGRGRNMRGQERAMNYETFGEDLQFTSGSRGGRRGRGRGGRGRGRGTQQQSQ